MSVLARLAVGTTQQGSDAVALNWALARCLSLQVVGVQSFLSRATFVAHDGGCTRALRPRHLDSWLMAADLCHEILAHGTPAGGLALVEGEFSPSDARANNGRFAAELPNVHRDASGGCLETLCRWLDLPRLVILDASQLDPCSMPPLPASADGVFLDRVNDLQQAARLETQLASLYGTPVFGWLGKVPRLRAAIAALPPGAQPAESICQALSEELQPTLRLERLLNLAVSRPWQEVPRRLFQARDVVQPLRVAVAHDEAFRGYFQETLDMLELRGASIEVFSPLRDESLPLDTDVVYIGCGHPQRFAEALSNNSCLLLALRQHWSSGNRIYGEGGGMAYLCQQIELPDGNRHEMVGALPAVARYRPRHESPRPVELTLRRGNWLGEGWSRVRGYRHPCWELVPNGPLVQYAGEEGDLDLVGRHHALGSRIHINFAAQLDYLDSFFQPHAPALDAVVS